MTTEERLLRLEGQLRNLRRTSLVLLFAVFALALWPYLSFGRKVIRADALVLTGANGAYAQLDPYGLKLTRSRTGTDPGVVLEGIALYGGTGAAGLGPNLLMVARSGASASLMLLDGNTSLSLRDKTGSAVLGSTETETPDGRRITHPVSSLHFFGPDGKAISQAPFR